MFSKTIFKQTLKQNWKLWAIFTALTAVMGAVIITVFDPRMMQQMMDMLADTPMGGMMGDVGGAFSFLGMIGDTFYGMQGYILPLVFVIMTGNSLIASQVDRGSMAYTLSTPIKRTKVVCTQAIYMILSVFAMFAVVTLVGLGAVQLAHNGLWGEAYTPDVVAAANVLDLSQTDVANDLTLIVNNPAAFTAGAEARGIGEEVYLIYLTLTMESNATDADELEPQDDVSGEQYEAMQASFITGLEAAAEVLDMDIEALGNNLGRITANSAALSAMSEASGMPEEMIVMMINTQLALGEMELDLPLDFDVMAYVNLNVGIALLLFAVGGISFLFSCVFNLTKNSLALGAGIPIAFLLIEIMAGTSGDLESLRYLSLNTLFDPSAITGGGTFVPQFVVLATIGIVLYVVGIKVFKEKDLPL